MSDQPNELVPEVKDLSVNMTERAVTAMQEQRRQLGSFVASQLKLGINGDYAQIPGTPKKSLLKPGAEKLANLFKLGSRIISKDRIIDHDKNFAMFSYVIEIYHIPSGAVISQCEGSANSDEKKNKNKPFADQLNSLGKMAQKRGFVGGVIMAVGASDFFTQDVEDMPGFGTPKGQEKASVVQAIVRSENVEAASDIPKCDLCQTYMKRTKGNNAWFCPNFNDKSQGEHDYRKDQ